MERASRSWDTFLLEIGDLTKTCTFLVGLPYPPQEQFFESSSQGRHKTSSIVGFLAC